MRSESLNTNALGVQQLSMVLEEPRIISLNYGQEFRAYSREDSVSPIFFLGDALEILRELPDESIDCVMTSPPYWGQRYYQSGTIGLEPDWMTYVSVLTGVFAEVKRVLKTTGSFWLNIGDSYHAKGMLGLPWRVCFRLIDEQGWILRNSVIWNKVKGGLDNTPDRLANAHENVFHFVKSARGYYYDLDAIRSRPGESKVVDGKVVSATGVSGIRYKRQLELSTALAPDEKAAAFKALEDILSEIGRGDLADFRMIIRGQQRATHSDSEKVSGRARELSQRGFYFLRYHPKGSKPSDVWDILPEDTQKRQSHFAPYPEDLCRMPILATCPQKAIVLDPFCGTGTTMYVAASLGRKSIGIDIVEPYLEIAASRVATL